LTEAPKDVSKVTGEAKYGVKGAEQSSEQRVVPLFGDKEADFDQNAHKEDAVNNDVSTSGADNSGSGEESSSLCRVIIDEEERESSELSPYENEDETMTGIENVSEANHFIKSTDDSAVKEKLFSEDMWDQGYQEHSREWNESGKGQTPPEGSLDGDDPSVFNDAPFEEAMLSDGASEQMLFMGGSGNSDDAESNVCPKSFFGNMDDNMEALYDLSDANKNASAEELGAAALL
uniref:Uncharacterized protein n=1 Tax=Parascaris univalens TaxID=6257 RepID=A0A914ZX05_PARUN